MKKPENIFHCLQLQHSLCFWLQCTLYKMIVFNISINSEIKTIIWKLYKWKLYKHKLFFIWKIFMTKRHFHILNISCMWITVCPQCFIYGDCCTLWLGLGWLDTLLREGHLWTLSTLGHQLLDLLHCPRDARQKLHPVLCDGDVVLDTNLRKQLQK